MATARRGNRRIRQRRREWPEPLSADGPKRRIVRSIRAHRQVRPTARNRVGRRRLEQLGQPVVGIVLRQSGTGKGCGKESCRGPAENRRGDGHGVRPRWRTLASIGSRRNGYLLCYRTINLQFVGVRLRKFASSMDSHNSNTMRLSDDGGFRPPPTPMQHHPRSFHKRRDSACSALGPAAERVTNVWPPVPRSRCRTAPGRRIR